MLRMSKQKRMEMWMSEQRHLLNEQEVAYLLGIPTKDFRTLRQNGQFVPPLDIVGKPRWTHGDVAAYIQAKKRRRFLEGLRIPEKPIPSPDFDAPEELCHLGDKLQENIAFPPCVYFLYNFGTLIYVGQSKNLPIRLSQHRKGSNKAPPKEFNRVFFLQVNPEDLDVAERHFIAELDPLMNRVGLPKN